MKARKRFPLVRSLMLGVLIAAFCTPMLWDHYMSGVIGDGKDRPLRMKEDFHIVSGLVSLLGLVAVPLLLVGLSKLLCERRVRIGSKVLWLAVPLATAIYATSCIQASDSLLPPVREIVSVLLGKCSLIAIYLGIAAGTTMILNLFPNRESACSTAED